MFEDMYEDFFTISMNDVLNDFDDFDDFDDFFF